MVSAAIFFVVRSPYRLRSAVGQISVACGALAIACDLSDLVPPISLAYPCFKIDLRAPAELGQFGNVQKIAAPRAGSANPAWFTVLSRSASSMSCPTSRRGHFFAARSGKKRGSYSPVGAGGVRNSDGQSLCGRPARTGSSQSLAAARQAGRLSSPPLKCTACAISSSSPSRRRASTGGAMSRSIAATSGRPRSIYCRVIRPRRARSWAGRCGLASQSWSR
jgi:hypothetical protein